MESLADVGIERTSRLEESCTETKPTIDAKATARNRPREDGVLAARTTPQKLATQMKVCHHPESESPGLQAFDQENTVSKHLYRAVAG